jgi:modulator of FtsH protease HflK
MRRWLLILIAALLLCAWLLTGVKEIRPGERAVVRRFGRVLDVQPPGLWIGLPWGIDRVDRVAIEQVRSVTIGYRPGDPNLDDAPPGQLLTGDRNLINVSIIINYTVKPEEVIAYVEQQERADELIARAAEAALAEWVAGRNVDEVQLKGKTALPLELLPRLQPRLDACGLGVRIRNIDVPHVAPPDDVKSAFDRVAQAAVEARTMVEKAREETQTREREVSAQISKMNLDTGAYATIRPGQARAEAVEFEQRLRAYRVNPLVREAGRWTHLLQMARRLMESGQVQPLDPDIDSPLRK